MPARPSPIRAPAVMIDAQSARMMSVSFFN
jgi:hypothetical protein